MKPRRPTTDGFVPRRQTSPLTRRTPEQTRRPTPMSTSDIGRRRAVSPATGSTGLRRPVAGATAPAPERSDRGLTRTAQGMSHSNQGLRRSDIDESLNALNDQPLEPPRKRRRHKIRKPKKPTTRNKRIIKWVVISVLIIGLLVGGWVAYRVLSNSGNIFKGGILGLIQNQPLKQDADGRSNILILGTSDDDPDHPGGNLTDSMMIVSINQTTKEAAMMSIPRDLYVRYGMACQSGYEGKINAYFWCANDGEGADAEQDRLTKTRQFIGDIFGMDIQYAVNVNNKVIVEAVDAVGGIDVDIKGNGPVPYGVAEGSILDRNFDWRCNYTCHYVKYSPGVHHLDGEHALFLSMARGHSAPTYGLASSNFDREKNQQKIMVALKDKAASTGTLANVGKVTGLMDALGNNLRTTFETKEIRTLMSLGVEIDTANIRSIDLLNEDNPVVKTGTYGGASVVMPSAGIFDYTGIRSMLKKELSSNPVTREGADVVVANGSETAGLAQTEANKLTEAGYLVSGVTNAPEGTYPAVTIYKLNDTKPKTAEKLASRFNVQVVTGPSPIVVTGDTDFVIIFGPARAATSAGQ